MLLHVEIDQEADGRWIAEIADLPGVMAYGPTPGRAVCDAKVLALRVLADRLAAGELHPDDLPRVSFVQATG